MPLFSSINRNTNQFFTTIGADLVNWEYTPGTEPTLTPVDTAAWPAGFQLKFYSTSSGRFESLAGNSSDYPTSHGHSNRQWFLDDEDTFALISTTTTPGNTDFRLLMASKFAGAPETTLAADGTVVFGSTAWDGWVAQGFAYDAGLPTAEVFRSITTNTYSNQFTSRSYPPLGPSTTIDGRKLLQRVALIEPASREYFGLCTRIFQDPAVSASQTSTPAGVEDKTYVTDEGTEQRFLHLWRQSSSGRGGWVPFDIYIPFDGVIDNL